MLNCELHINSIDRHLQQIYTGYSELAKKGVFDSFKIYQNEGNDKKHIQTLFVKLNNVKIIYDTRDDYNIPKEYLDFGFDFYFKRSCCKDYFKDIKDSHRIYPLGFNYLVSSDSNFALKLKYILKYSDRLKNILRLTGFSEFLFDYKWETIYNQNIEKFPKFSSSPLILFMTRTWDPEEIKNSEEKKEERKYINETRAQCIRLGRKEFGNNFFGGFESDNFSIKNYKDCCLENKKVSTKKDYFKVLDKASICISTMGLHKSVGWKMGEYIAKSKAIVSEEFISEFPGDFHENKNYLLFKEPDQFIEQTYKLINDNNFRHQMMLNNWQYYNLYVKPEVLVFNSIYKTFSLLQDK